MWAELNGSVSAILERHVYWRHLLDHHAATRLQFALGYAVPILVSQALKAQSAQIDGVSGATDTSHAFMQALANALQKVTS